MARKKRPPRPDGHYWILDLPYGTVFVMLSRDGRPPGYRRFEP